MTRPKDNDADAARRIEELAVTRHPFQTYLLFLACAAGLRGLLRGSSSPLQEAIPRWEGIVWAGLLVAGAVLALVGMYWRRRETGLVLERSGLIGVGAAALVHAGFLTLYEPSRATFSVAVTAAFGFACFAQARKLSKLIVLLVHHREGPS